MIIIICKRDITDKLVLQTANCSRYHFVGTTLSIIETTFFFTNEDIDMDKL